MENSRRLVVEVDLAGWNIHLPIIRYSISQHPAPFHPKAIVVFKCLRCHQRLCNTSKTLLNAYLGCWHRTLLDLIAK